MNELRQCEEAYLNPDGPRPYRVPEMSEELYEDLRREREMEMAIETLTRDLDTNCVACQKPMLKGQRFLMLPVGPGDDEEARAKRDEGRSYNSIAVLLHWDCASKDVQFLVTK